jgi:phosphotriesterase-related protein
MTRYPGKVMTVTGPIDPRKLGVTLMHEHLFIDSTRFFSEPSSKEDRKRAHKPVSMELLGWIRANESHHLDNVRLDDEKVATEEIMEFKRRGGLGFVDATPRGIGRNPAALKRIAEKTGMNIIAGTGYYIGEAHPKELAKKTIEEVAQEMIDEVERGIEGTSVRSGIIGEIGTSHPLLDGEEKVVRAAARAQQETGASITIHPGRDERSPMKVLNILQAEGADIERVVMGHLDRTIGDVGKLEELARQGCCLEFDLFGFEAHFDWSDFDLPNDAGRIALIRKLLQDGYVDQIAMSQDVCSKLQLRRYGGYGYAHIIQNIVRWMKAKGVTQGEIDRMLIETPKRLLTLARV